MLGGIWGGRQELESQEDGEGRRCWNLEDAIKKKREQEGISIF